MIRFAVWLLDAVPLPGWVQPYVFGLIIGRWPRRAKENGDPKTAAGACSECGLQSMPDEAPERKPALRSEP